MRTPLLAPAALAVLLLAGCGTIGPIGPAGPSAPPTATPSPTAAPTETPSASEPANVGDLKSEAIDYYESGAYFVDLEVVADDAIQHLEDAVDGVARPAVVFDIDDTLLSNWQVIRADDFGRVIPGPCTDLPARPCGWREWDLLGIAPALPQSLEIYQRAQELGASIFLITGRDEGQRDATQRNLEAAGYTGYTALIMPAQGAHYDSAVDFKAPQREQIEAQGYTIVANIGDQPSDLEGGFALETFKLPNPFYRIP
jgi:hypothetical protein